MKNAKMFPHKHDTINAPAKKVGEIISRPETDEEKAETALEAKIRKFEESNRHIIYGPLSVEQMLKGIDDAKERSEFRKEKEAKAEAKRLKAEAKKAAKEAAKKEIAMMKAVLADAEAEAKKAEEIAKAQERAEANKAVAIGVTPVEALGLMEELENYNSLIAAMVDEMNVIMEERDDLRTTGRTIKSEISELEAKLKAPMKSSAYRNLLVEKAINAQKFKINVDRRVALIKKGGAIIKEKKALTIRINILKKYGNSATRPTISAYQNLTKKLRRNSLIEEGVRQLETIIERMKRESFQVPSWSSAKVLEASGLAPLFEAVNGYHPWEKDKKVADKNMTKALEAIKVLEARHDKKEAIRLSIKDSTPTRLQGNIYSLCMTIDTESPDIQREWIVVEHMFHTLLKPSWRLFHTKKEQGEKMARDFVERVHELLDNIEVTWWNDEVVKYNGLYSSASHQKKEKLVSCNSDLMEVHEELVWFGKTKKEVFESDVTGAEIWKMRANLARPLGFAITLEDGTPVLLHHVYMVKDKKKTYHLNNALLIGGNHNGKLYELTSTDADVILGDGAATSRVQLNVNAFQGGGAGVKLMYVNGKDAFPFAEKKRNKKAVMPEGKLIVCGDGCFKFDKLWDNYDAYAAKMDEMAERYPGINQLYALRQSEELEDEEKIRQISRSLSQQLFIAGDDEMYKLAELTVDSLLYKKTFEGLFSSLAELGLPIEKRSDLAKLILECPELLTNINVQLIGKTAWEHKQSDAIGNKLRTKGQYPYIMQDIVALIEVWLLDVDPNDPDLGVLKNGEVSAVGVKEGKEMVIIRYPANFLTAKTVVCKPYIEIFGCCGNVAILSIHDDVLIIQDGDVDGDEAGLFYDKILVALVNKMRRLTNPPVVVFEHGKKGDREKIEAEAARLTEEAKKKAELEGKSVWKVYKAEDILRKRMYSALYSAKEYDSVGKYANLARDLAYLLSIDIRTKAKALREGNEAIAAKCDKDYRDHLLWMAAASTGAILAIDQVKGNAIDPKLIEWLESIETTVKSMLVKPVEVERDGKKIRQNKYFAPFTQPYVKGDFSIETLDRNPMVGTDNLGYNVLMATGKWEHNPQEFVENKEKLALTILDHSHPYAAIQSGYVTSGLLTELRPNYFNREFKGRDGSMVNPDAKIMNLIENNYKVGQKDLLLLFWRNMHTLEFRMQEKTVPGKRKAYCQMVRRTIIDHALSTPWFASEYTQNYECGHEYTKEEKITNVVNAAIVDALELGRRGNGLPAEDKGSYAKFILSVFAEDIIENVRRNNVDIRNFMVESSDNFNVDAEYEETNFDVLDNDCEDYDAQASECEPIDYSEDTYQPTEEELEELFRMQCVG